MGGMSEFSMMLDHYGVGSQAGYVAFTATVIVVGYFLLMGVRFWIDRMFGK
jgi:type IV secretory pathway VirB6-like protein